MGLEYTAKKSDLRLTTDQADLVRRRVQPFANTAGIQTCTVMHLLQEAYLQGMADAVEGFAIERDKLKSENDWLHSKLAQFSSNA
jgi:hypothetical protein